MSALNRIKKVNQDAEIKAKQFPTSTTVIPFVLLTFGLLIEHVRADGADTHALTRLIRFS